MVPALLEVDAAIDIIPLAIILIGIQVTIMVVTMILARQRVNPVSDLMQHITTRRATIIILRQILLIITRIMTFMAGGGYILVVLVAALSHSLAMERINMAA